jgi:hypothetical protein
MQHTVKRVNVVAEGDQAVLHLHFVALPDDEDDESFTYMVSFKEIADKFFSEMTANQLETVRRLVGDICKREQGPAFRTAAISNDNHASAFNALKSLGVISRQAPQAVVLTHPVLCVLLASKPSIQPQLVHAVQAADPLQAGVHLSPSNTRTATPSAGRHAPQAEPVTPAQGTRGNQASPVASQGSGEGPQVTRYVFLA